MSLEIIIGKNKTGKTIYLDQYKNNDPIESEYKNKEFVTLFLPAELDFEGVLKGNWGTSKKEFLPPHVKIINFLNKIVIGNNYKFKLDENEYKKLKENQNNFSKFIDLLKEDNDPFFENIIKDNLEINNLSINEFDYAIDLFNFKEQKRNDISGSSGSLNFSLIKIIYKMILDKKFEINEKFILIIDEIEKFLHPELVFKVANMIVKISEKIKVILTTHSPIFLERIFYIHKNSIKKNDNLEIKYLLKYKYGNENIEEINNYSITKILKEKNYRFLTNLSHALFSSKIFLIEGLIDNTLINDIISVLDLDDVHYTVIDCGSKYEIEKMYKALSELNIIKHYKICLFYDVDKKDRRKKFKINNANVVSITFDPNIEESLFLEEEIKIGNNKNKTLCIKTKKGFVNRKKFKHEELSFVDKENIKDTFFCFTMEWIKSNSTKNKSEINKKLNDLTEKIKKFLTDN